MKTGTCQTKKDWTGSQVKYLFQMAVDASKVDKPAMLTNVHQSSIISY